MRARLARKPVLQGDGSPPNPPAARVKLNKIAAEIRLRQKGRSDSGPSEARVGWLLLHERGHLPQLHQ